MTTRFTHINTILKLTITFTKFHKIFHIFHWKYYNTNIYRIIFLKILTFKPNNTSKTPTSESEFVHRTRVLWPAHVNQQFASTRFRTCTINDGPCHLNNWYTHEGPRVHTCPRRSSRGVSSEVCVRGCRARTLAHEDICACGSLRIFDCSVYGFFYDVVVIVCFLLVT